RPILQCVNFVAKEGKLTLVSADGFRLALISLDYDDGEGQALINREELLGVANALRKAKRARVSFEGEDVTKPSSLIIDTELIRYKWTSADGSYPEWKKLIPTEFNTFASFDSVEAIKATNSLRVNGTFLTPGLLLLTPGSFIHGGGFNKGCLVAVTDVGLGSADLGVYSG
ncbi:unnamed protein product, partial [marine sediment metagenome]